MKSTKLLVLVAAGLLALTGCGKGDSGKSGSSAASIDPTNPENLANGIYTFVNEPNAERTKILGLLEKYASSEKLTGLTLFNNGGYAIYSNDIVKGTNNYIRGYGFGILSEGEIKADLAGETNAAWKRYLHSYESEDPGYLNYMNDKGSVVGDLQGYVNASYFQTKMNATKDGYDWVGDLATVDRPIAVNKSAETGLATKFKFPVKVGADLKYTTLSSKYAAYNNREVALEDYITPYKIYYTKAYGMVRGSENLTGSGSIKGSSSYYNASANGFNQAKWDQLGIKAYEEGGKSYLEFELNLPCNEFFAMYYLSNSMFAPVPEAFIKEIGGGDFAQGIKNWGANSSDLSESPLDHWLSTGAYTLEKWDDQQQIVFKKNPNYADGGRYKIAGVHLQVLKAINTDPNAAIKEFEANKIHSCGIPADYLDKYKSDERTATTIGSSNFKLNLNVCTQEVWNELFGEDGSVTQTAEADYWACEPAMANKDFVSGLSFALDRKTLAEKNGRTPAFEYFSPTYLSDPENGKYYNDTPEHKAAVADLTTGTDPYGYSLEKAKAAFKKAADKLVEDGVYNNGDTVEIEIAWMYASDEDEYHNDIKKNLLDAFNTPDNPLKLDVKFWVGENWSDVYYDKLMTGQFDIGFGSISGNTYNPLNFLEVLKSDNSSGFTLNWGINTNAVDANNPIVYNGKVWSFDALWTAADQGAFVKDGQNAQIDVGWNNASAKLNDDGTIVFEADFLEAVIKDEAGKDAAESFVSNINFWSRYDYVYGPDGNPTAYADALEIPIVRDDFVKGEAAVDANGLRIRHIKITIPADVVTTWSNGAVGVAGMSKGWTMFDIYYSKNVYGIEGGTFSPGSVYLLALDDATGEFTLAGDDTMPVPEAAPAAAADGE